MVVAVLQGLKHKYSGLEDAEKGKHTDIIKEERDLLRMETPSIRFSIVSKIGYMHAAVQGVPHRSGAPQCQALGEWAQVQLRPDAGEHEDA